MKVEKVEFLSLLGGDTTPWTFKIKGTGEMDPTIIQAPFWVIWNNGGKTFGLLTFALKGIGEEVEAARNIDNEKAVTWVAERFLNPDGTHYDKHLWTVPVTIEDVKRWKK